MRTLLTGNGINIQFDSKSYSSQQIVLRVLKNCDREDFPVHVIADEPFELKSYFGLLFLEGRRIIAGEYDDIPTCRAERIALEDFKSRYGKSIKSLKITDIGFEDYYFIHDMACHKSQTGNPDHFQVLEAMKKSYLYAIYNDGKLCELYHQYPIPFLSYLKSFDHIFTTNYDSNLESATGSCVRHLHGQFDVLSDVYNEESLRNKLPDSPVKTINMDWKYSYLYCNGLSTYSGKYKEFHIKQAAQANEGLEQYAAAYYCNPQVHDIVDSWAEEDGIMSNLGYLIKLKVQHPELSFDENYYFDEFKSTTGTLEILGLSPWNDLHIFEAIDSAEVEDCIYYYFSESDAAEVERLLPNLKRKCRIRFSPVKSFWEAYK